MTGSVREDRGPGRRSAPAPDGAPPPEDARDLGLPGVTGLTGAVVGFWLGTQLGWAPLVVLLAAGLGFLAGTPQVAARLRELVGDAAGGSAGAARSSSAPSAPASSPAPSDGPAPPTELPRITCPYCRAELRSPEELVACEACATPQHAECFAVAQGCPVQACGGTTSRPLDASEKPARVAASTEAAAPGDERPVVDWTGAGEGDPEADSDPLPGATPRSGDDGPGGEDSAPAREPNERTTPAADTAGDEDPAAASEGDGSAPRT